MRQQTERRNHRRHARDREAVESTGPAPDLDDLRHEIAEILDEIDEVLEENAEEFVKGYVQKGGQ